MSNPNPEFYSILNVNRDATTEEIKSAYRRLCIVFHPDKQIDLQKKEAAEQHFPLIQLAYDVLSDKTKREIYNNYGYEGIQKTWQVGFKLDKLDNLKIELELDKMKEKMLQEESGFIIKGTTSAHVDLSSSFEPGVYLDQRIPEFEGLTVEQSFERHLNDSSSVQLITNLVAMNGVGHGKISSFYRKTFRDYRGEIGVGLGNEKFVSLSVFKPVWKGYWSQVGLTQRSLNSLPISQLTLGKSFGEDLHFSLTLHHNFKMFFIYNLRYGNKFPLNATIRFSDSTFIAELSKLFKMSERSTFKLKSTIGNEGFVVSVGATLNLNLKSKAHASLESASKFGSVLKFSWTRGSQTFALPLFLSHEFSLQTSFFGFLIPSVLIGTAYEFIYKPLLALEESRKLQEIASQEKEFLERKRSEALQAFKVMKETSEKKKIYEESIKGLVIVSAIYGNFLDEKKLLDVTVQLQFLVHESQLHLSKGPKYHLLGFYDPCFGEQKQLKIKYIFKEKFHERTFEENETVILPMKSHLI